MTNERVIDSFARLTKLGFENWQNSMDIIISNTEHLLGNEEKKEDTYRGVTPFDVIFQFDTMRVLKFHGSTDTSGKTPLLLVPSMINRPYVMDLMKDSSLAGYLRGSGVPTYLLDWGTPERRHNHLSFDFYVDDVIKLACDAVVKDACCERATDSLCKGTGCNKISLLGYCMGGTMSLLHTALYPERIEKLTLLAAPTNFVDDSTLSRWARKEIFDVDFLVDTVGAVDPSMLQSSFLMVKPLSQLLKWKSLYDSSLNTKAVESYINLEKWVTDNISVPKEAYRKYVKMCYHENSIVKNKVTLKGKKLDLRSLKVPILNIMAKKDHIVEVNSSRIIREIVSSPVTEVFIDAGHIGVAMGRKAREMFDAVSKYNLGKRVIDHCIMDYEDNPAIQ
ncbi:MAG: alpha/beta fold hydrolase [Candidatus Riflebacteria bacterium]|nr:alpha/beta fold hydrolase [Candidatus Riflebacteria bacterium]